MKLTYVINNAASAQMRHFDSMLENSNSYKVLEEKKNVVPGPPECQHFNTVAQKHKGLRLDIRQLGASVSTKKGSMYMSPFSETLKKDQSVPVDEKRPFLCI